MGTLESSALGGKPVDPLLAKAFHHPGDTADVTVGAQPTERLATLDEQRAGTEPSCGYSRRRASDPSAADQHVNVELP